MTWKCKKIYSLQPGVRCNRTRCKRYPVYIFTVRIPKKWKINVFTLCVSPHPGRWLPHLHPIILSKTSRGRGWYLSAWSQALSWEGRLQSQTGGTPARSGWYSHLPPSTLDWMGYPPGDRAAQRVLARRRAVCLFEFTQDFLVQRCLSGGSRISFSGHSICTLDPACDEQFDPQ